MNYVCMCCRIFFLVVCGITGCISRRAPAVIPQIVPSIQQLEHIKPVVEKSCQDKAWDFNPEKDIPNFSDTCAWNFVSMRTPWVYGFSTPFLKRDISMEIGCIRRYQHRYANVIGAEFYVFCRTDAHPDILGWGVKYGEALGWVAVADGDTSWISLGWSPQLDIEADITKKPLQIRWIRFLFQYKGGVVLRLFSK